MSAATMMLLLKGALSDMPEEDKQKVQDIAQTLRGIIKANGDHGAFALSLVGAELSVEEERKEKAGKK